MSDISEKIIFKKDSGHKLAIDQKFIGLKVRQNGIMTVNFRTPEEEMKEVKKFFEGFKSLEPIKLDIGETGDIECYFKGISPLLNQTDDAGLKYFFLSVTLQELKDFEEEVPNCGCF